MFTRYRGIPDPQSAADLHPRPTDTNQSGHYRPRAKLGLDLSAWMAITFVTLTVFLVGFRLAAMMAFPTLAVGAWLIIRKHPRYFNCGA